MRKQSMVVLAILGTTVEIISDKKLSPSLPVSVPGLLPRESYPANLATYNPESGQEPCHPMLTAAFKGDCATVRTYLAEKCDPNYQYGTDQPHAGINALQGALYANSYECLLDLLKAGANPNNDFESPLLFQAPDEQLNTRNIPPLLDAIGWRRDQKFIKTLIEYGAQVNSQYPVTPLSLALFMNDMKTFQTLLAYGADPYLHGSSDGHSAAEYASAKSRNKAAPDKRFEAALRQTISKKTSVN